jgi:hypothetical protein
VEVQAQRFAGQQRRQFALFRSSAAVAVVAALMAGAIYLPPGPVPGAQVGVEFDAASPLQAPAVTPPTPPPMRSRQRPSASASARVAGSSVKVCVWLAAPLSQARIESVGSAAARLP